MSDVDGLRRANGELVRENQRLESLVGADVARENRTLRYFNKQLGKQLGRAGETIHRLRAEIALLRSMGGINAGDYQRLLEQKRAAEAENARLRDKLAGAELANEVAQRAGV